MSDDAGVLPPINASVGEFIEIKVPSNRTTGYFCCLAEMPGCVYLESTEYVPEKPKLFNFDGYWVYNILALSMVADPLSFGM